MFGRQICLLSPPTMIFSETEAVVPVLDDGLEPSRGSGWAASRVAGFACTLSRHVGVSPGTYSPSPCDSADAAPLGGQGPSVSSTCWRPRVMTSVRRRVISDGSNVEVNERSVLAVSARGRNMTVAVDNGAVIVQAATIRGASAKPYQKSRSASKLEITETVH